MVTLLGCPWGLAGSGASSRSLPSLGLTQPSLSSGHSGSFLQAFPPTSLILPSQNRVVLLITIHCPLQSASPRMSVHQNVNKHHRKRFHQQVTLEDVVYGEAEHDGAPPLEIHEDSGPLRL